MSAGVSAWHAGWALLRLRMRRQMNQLALGFTRRKAAKGRAAVGRKGGGVMPGIGVIALGMLAALPMARNAVLNLHCALGPGIQCQFENIQRSSGKVSTQVAEHLHQVGLQEGMIGGLSLVMSLMFLTTLLVPLGNKELSSPDWDLEWLVTLPLPRSALLATRIVVRGLVNPIAWFVLLPPLLVTGFYGPLGWQSLPVALLCAICLGLMTATGLTLVDTGLRMRLAPSRLRNIQATASITAILPMYLAMSYGMGGHHGVSFEWARQFPVWATWLPPGLAVQVLAAKGAQLWLLLTALVAASMGVLAAGVALLGHMLRDGVVGAGLRESGRQPQAVRVEASLRWRSPVQRRELLLLRRDRNFLVQTLLLPVIIVTSQLLLQGNMSQLSSMQFSASLLVSITFGIGVYMLMMSAFQAILTEGQALWLLYSVPSSLEAVLLDKARLWATLVMAYPIVVLGIGGPLSSSPWHEVLGKGGWVVLGLVVFSYIAMGLGVFGANPLSEQNETRLKPTYTYLYFLLSGIYGYSVAILPLYNSVVLLLLFGALAFALWQKARDHLPFLLDPTAAPPQRVSAADGLIAAVVFFVLQGTVMLFIKLIRGDAVLYWDYGLAFGVAGLLTYLMCRYTFWRLKTAGVPRLLGERNLQGIGLGVLIGLGLGGVAIAYLKLVSWAGVPIPASPLSKHAWAMVAMMVVAAPLAEEFIFRGLLFGGMVRSLRPGQAMLGSAALFAVVHPLVAVPPVFLAGLATAWIYRRHGGLLAPMALHATYNGLLVGLSLLAG